MQEQMPPALELFEDEISISGDAAGMDGCLVSMMQEVVVEDV